MATVPKIWSDLDHRLFADSHGALALVINEQAVQTSIDNILGTHPGERIFLPQFASGLKSLLFEPINEAKLSNFATNVKNAIETWDNRVIVQGVDLSVDTDNHYISITISFNIPGITQLLTQTTQISA